jgi:D-methionine transport system substrate-binding protein
MIKSVVFTLAGLSLLIAQTLHAAPLRVAADPIPHAEILEYVKKIDPKLDLKIVEMSSGGINPNELLSSGDVDANYFQHLPYLKDQEKALGKTFSVAADVHIEPLGIYSHKIKSLADLPEGASIAVPNNAPNLSRSLHLLQDKGVIKLKDTGNAVTTLVTPEDIVDNPKKIKIVQIESPQIPRALDDVDAAIINGNYALEAGLVPAKDALGLESADHNPYANLLVTRPELLKDPRIVQLAKDLTSPQVAKFIKEKYNGSVIPVATSQHD